MNIFLGFLDKIKAHIIAFSKAMFVDERKTPVPEFLCDKVTGLQSAALFVLKKRLRYERLPKINYV